jgi:glyoxylase-like metal-dependent hydrolase (beta-lactamase superfamily II)
MDNPVLEVYFIDVGQGDSTFIVTPGRKKILVDGGLKDRALRFLAWKYRLSDVDEAIPLVIDLLVTSHADEDHIGGLIPIVKHPKIQIKEIIHGGLATFNEGIYSEILGDTIIQNGEEYLVTRHNRLNELVDGTLSDTFDEWKKAIIAKGGINYHAVDASSSLINIGDPKITLKVLGPRLDENQADNTPIYRWFDTHSHTINGHSLILKLTHDNTVTLLLSGDLNIEGSKNLLEDANLSNLMDAHILKAPHHGSHEYHRPWLDSVNPQISIISSGDAPDHGHPRAKYLGAVGQSSRSNEPLVFSTEIAATFLEAGEEVEDVVDLSTEELEALDDNTLAILRTLFKRRLHGMINVRTDGEKLYAARRVATGYWWESYGPITPTTRSV